MRLLRAIQRAFGPRSSRWITDEEDLAQMMAELDEAHPGWDFSPELLQEDVMLCLRNGCPQETARTLFGDEAVSAATLELATRAEKSRS